MNIFNNLNLRGNTAEDLKIKQAVVEARTGFDSTDASTGTAGEIAYSGGALYYHAGSTNGWQMIGTNSSQPQVVDGSFNLISAGATYNGNSKTLQVSASSSGASNGTQLKVGFDDDKKQLIFYTGSSPNTATHPAIDLSSLSDANIPSTIIKTATFDITSQVGTSSTNYTIDITHNLSTRFVDVSVYRTDDASETIETVWDKVICEIQVISTSAVKLKLYGTKTNLNGYYKVIIIGTSSPGTATPGTGTWAQD